MPTDRKRAIADTLLNMVRRQDVDKITATALIRESGISRQTFYYHFKDLMEVYEWAVRQAMGELVAQSLRAGSTRDALEVFLSFSQKNVSLLRKMLDSRNRGQLERLLMEGIRTYLEELARHRYQGAAVRQKDLEILLQFTSFGMVGIILNNCGKSDFDQGRLASQLERMLESLQDFLA